MNLWWTLGLSLVLDLIIALYAFRVGQKFGMFQGRNDAACTVYRALTALSDNPPIYRLIVFDELHAKLNELDPELFNADVGIALTEEPAPIVEVIQ